MPRVATGELRHLADGTPVARITIEGRERHDFPLVTVSTDAEALERKAALAHHAACLRKAGKSAAVIVALLEQGARARRGRAWQFVVDAVDAECEGRIRVRDASTVPTFGEWARQWTANEIADRYPDHVEKKKPSSIQRDSDVLRLYVLPHVKDVRVDEFTLADAESVMAAIPAADPRRPTKPLRAGTRRHIAQTMARLMRLAVYPGRYREVSPIPPAWLPRGDGASSLAKECLYPDEDALLLGGRSVQEDHWGNMKQDVPVLRRLAYAFLMREGMRTDEMGKLRWGDVDLKRGRVTLDENKTDDPRDWALRPDVAEALARWKHLQTETEPHDYVFAEDGVPLPIGHLADRLRVDLLRVGVTRPQLFERKHGVRMAIRAHDLRATFVTVGLATGKTETWISDRTGHKSHAMIERYRRKAREWNLGELGPMHDLIPELAAVRLPHGLPHAAAIAENSQRAQRKPMP